MLVASEAAARPRARRCRSGERATRPGPRPRGWRPPPRAPARRRPGPGSGRSRCRPRAYRSAASRWTSPPRCSRRGPAARVPSTRGERRPRPGRVVRRVGRARRAAARPRPRRAGRPRGAAAATHSPLAIVRIRRQPSPSSAQQGLRVGAVVEQGLAERAVGQGGPLQPPEAAGAGRRQGLRGVLRGAGGVAAQGPHPRRVPRAAAGPTRRRAASSTESATAKNPSQSPANRACMASHGAASPAFPAPVAGADRRRGPARSPSSRSA